MAQTPPAPTSPRIVRNAASPSRSEPNHWTGLPIRAMNNTAVLVARGGSLRMRRGSHPPGGASGVKRHRVCGPAARTLRRVRAVRPDYESREQHIATAPEVPRGLGRSPVADEDQGVRTQPARKSGRASSSVISTIRLSQIVTSRPEYRCAPPHPTGASIRIIRSLGSLRALAPACAA